MRVSFAVFRPDLICNEILRVSFQAPARSSSYFLDMQIHIPLADARSRSRSKGRWLALMKVTNRCDLFTKSEAQGWVSKEPINKLKPCMKHWIGRMCPKPRCSVTSFLALTILAALSVTRAAKFLGSHFEITRRISPA